MTRLKLAGWDAGEAIVIALAETRTLVVESPWPVVVALLVGAVLVLVWLYRRGRRGKCVAIRVWPEMSQRAAGGEMG